MPFGTDDEVLFPSNTRFMVRNKFYDPATGRGVVQMVERKPVVMTTPTMKNTSAARQLAAFEEMRAGVRLRAMDPTAPRNVTHIKDDGLSGSDQEG